MAKLTEQKKWELLTKSFDLDLNVCLVAGEVRIASSRDAGTIYKVVRQEGGQTDYKCECPGFGRFNYCRHAIRAEWEVKNAIRAFYGKPLIEAPKGFDKSGKTVEEVAAEVATALQKVA